ncbi:MAG: metallophosphoesterase [Crocinitomicaceae bacterium]|nr:metallophosphoesterase [Crocinitomicaceae bacterium]
MNSSIVFAFLSVLLFYNYHSFYSTFDHPQAQMVVGILSIVAAVIGLLTLIRMNIVFRTGYGQSDLLTNWSMGVFFGIIISAIFVSVIFLLGDIGRFFVAVYEKFSAGSMIWPNRSEFVGFIAIFFSILPVSLFIYGMARGKYNFKVRDVQLRFADLPKAFDGYRIVQFSDLHSGNYDRFSAMEKATRMIKEQQADLILFTGDWINAKSDEIIPYKELFTGLNAPDGKFCCLGNHDYGAHPAWRDLEKYKYINDAVREHISDMTFDLLDNKNVSIKRGEDAIRLVGVENWGNNPFPRKGDLDQALTGVDSDEFKILLSHDPTHWDKKTLEHPDHIHLTLAGHTHGAQFGIETKRFQWSPVKYVYKRWGGLYEEKNQFLYVNRGLGFIGYAGRIGMRPEITVFELKSDG